MVAKLLAITVLSSVVISLGFGVTARESTNAESSSDRIALGGDCCVSLVEMGAYVKGEEKYSSRWRGVRYLFLSEDEKAVFESDPEEYAVAHGGLDIVATYGLDGPLADARKTYGSGRNTSRYEGKTYHFANDLNASLFNRNREDYIFRAKKAAYLQAEAKRGRSIAELYPEN